VLCSTSCLPSELPLSFSTLMGMHGLHVVPGVLACLTFLPRVWAHGALNRPSPRENRHNRPVHSAQGPGCAGEACGWFSEGCAIGCTCFGTTNGTVTGHGLYSTPDEMNCSSPIEPTLDAKSPFRTWNMELRSPQGDWTKYMPWRAPGSATPIDPCGVATDAPGGPWPWLPAPFADWLGQWQDAHHLGGRPAGYRRGFKGTSIPEPKDVSPTMWPAGGTAIVSHALFVNHGGGYQYRLCPKSRDGKPPSEACFQMHPLRFAKNFSVIHFEDGSRPDATIPAMDVTSGVIPAGSAWRRNPIPACNCDENDSCGEPDPDTGSIPAKDLPYQNEKGYGPECPTGVQFTPFCEGCFGWDDISFSILDEVVVPSEPGSYMLSWRWDCEQSPQIWNSCADIVIVGADDDIIV